MDCSPVRSGRIRPRAELGTMTSLHVLGLLVVTVAYFPVDANPPVFNSEYDKAVVFLPKDVKAGTAIYRFAASDNENQLPLRFSVNSRDEIVGMVNVSDTIADLVLLKSLPQSGEIRETDIVVTDQAGEFTQRKFRINVTDARGTPDHVFIEYENTYTVSENEKVGAVIGTVMARSDEHMYQHVGLDIKGSDMFKINPVLHENGRIVAGEIMLAKKLDYEKQSFYWIQIEAHNGYIEKPVDTRNIILLPVLILVKDEQDTPPIYSSDFPAVVTVMSDMAVGDAVTTVKAEDGDTDNKRPIRYSLEPGTDYQYFQMDPASGIITLTQSAEDVTQANRGVPIILHIKAEEIQAGIPIADSSASTTKDIVVLLESHPSMAPVFEQSTYEGDIEEHAPSTTAVDIKGLTRVSDGDVGMAGVFTLSLESMTPDQNIDRILEVVPSVVVNEGHFQIRVKNPDLLDYERFKELKFKVVAAEIKEPALSSSAMVTVHIKDVNDNNPMFTKDVYKVTIPEDAKEGTFIVQVTALDADSGQFGTVVYTKITGDIADRLDLDRSTGRVTISKTAHQLFDRETQQEHVLTIEASDQGNPAKTNTTTLRIVVQDVNDNAPQFKKGVYEVAVDPDTPQKEPFLQVEAVDADEPGNSNSIVRYEILRGNRGNTFRIDPQTGDLSLNKSPVLTASDETDALLGDTEDVDEPSTYTLTIRAYDTGIPHRNSTVVVYVHFKTDSRIAMNITIQYILPTSVEEINRDKERVERFLSKLNGASTTIERVAPYGLDDGYDRITRRSTLNDRSLVTTNVRYHKKSLVDLSFITRNGTAAVPILPPGDDGNERDEVREAGVSYSWKVALITLLIILAIILLLLICFCVWRQLRKVEERKVHPADEKTMDKSQSQVIEVVTATSDPMVMANGRQYPHQVGERERLIMRRTSDVVDSTDPTAVGARRNVTETWNVGAGPSLLNRGGNGGVVTTANRRPQLNYSRHLHGTDDGRGIGPGGGPVPMATTAGNSVRVELHDHERGTVKRSDDDLMTVADGPEVVEHRVMDPGRGGGAGAGHHHHHHHHQHNAYQRGYSRLGIIPAEDDDADVVDGELEEIIVVDSDHPAGRRSRSRDEMPTVRGIRRVFKRLPSRKQQQLLDNDYEEWDGSSSLPDWIGTDYDTADVVAVPTKRRTTPAAAYGPSGGRRMLVRKFRRGGGSLPGDKDYSSEGQWFNGGDGVSRRHRRNRPAGPPPTIKASPRPRHGRGRSLTRASLRVDKNDDEDDDDIDDDQDDSEDNLEDFIPETVGKVPAPVPVRDRTLRFDDKPVKTRTQSRGVSARPLVERLDSDSNKAPPTPNQQQQHVQQQQQQNELWPLEHLERDSNEAPPISNQQHVHRPLERDSNEAPPSSKRQHVQPERVPPQTKDSSTSPRINTPPNDNHGSARAESEEKSEDASPDRLSKSDSKSSLPPMAPATTTAPATGSRRAKRESRYMDWYKNLDRGTGAAKPPAVSRRPTKRRRKFSSPGGKTVDRDDDDDDDDDDETVADGAARRSRRRGSDPSSADHHRRPSQPRHHQHRRRRSTDPSSTARDNDDDRRRSGTALDVIEAQVRLGGDRDDEDSGIGNAHDSFRSSRKQFLEKKSLFTIAYNQNKQEPLKDRDSSANNAENRIT